MKKRLCCDDDKKYHVPYRQYEEPVNRDSGRDGQDDEE